jgi:uncharacterized membrane protein YphA (DoxX/SURF4 family)
MLVGLVFLASGLAKFRDFNGFTQSMQAYGWIRRQSTVRKLGFLISTAEVFTGAGLIGPFFVRVASIMGLILLAIFASVVAAALMKPLRPARCGCMVPLSADRLGWNVVLRNLGFTFLLLPSATAAPLTPCCAASMALLVISLILTHDPSESRHVTQNEA